MKKIFFLMTAALMAMSLCAAPVDQATAQSKARQFLANKMYAGKMMAASALNPVLVKTEMGDAKLNQPVYYIYNTSSTFIVVAGDDRAEEILVVGDRPLKDVDNLPLGLQGMLGQYKREIMHLQEYPNLKVNPIVSPQNTPSLRGTDTGGTYLLDCNWDQSEPYWNLCKFTSGSTTYQCYTGCPATSAAMVFYYWKYPTGPTGIIPGYESHVNYNYSYWTGTYSYVEYTHAALPSITFDWDNMIDSYSGSYTTAQANAVATLMQYVGHAERMEYGTYNAGGSGVDADSVANICNAFLLMGYNPTTTRYLKKHASLDYVNGQWQEGTQLYTDAEWAKLIQDEIAAERPIVFCGIGNGGHAFNVDGYNSSTNKYHCNFGWSGDGNAWCALNAFASDAGDNSTGTFSMYQQIVIGIQPAEGIMVSPKELNFTCFADATDTQTFDVTAFNVSGNLTLTLNDPDGVYSINTTSITEAEAAAGKTVTVTYAPTAVGTNNATITVSANGTDPVTVNLNGQATVVKYAPVMLDPNDTYVGLTQFRADWTDATPVENVSSYTLEVNTKSRLLGSIDGNDYTGSYTNITLTEPWGGTSVKGGNNAVYISSSGNITFTIPEGYSNATFTMKITTVTGNYGSGNITVNSVGHTFSKGETYSWVVTASSGDKITITTTDSSYSPDMALIEVYSGDVTAAMSLKASESGDATYRLITDITPDTKFYTVTGLTAEGTFEYKVKALFIDGTESAWSNLKEVTLHENAHPYTKGDVNHDNKVDVADVQLVIEKILGKGTTEICELCADVTGDGNIDVADVSGIIDIVLGKAQQ